MSVVLIRMAPQGLSVRSSSLLEVGEEFLLVRRARGIQKSALLYQRRRIIGAVGAGPIVSGAVNDQDLRLVRMGWR